MGGREPSQAGGWGGGGAVGGGWKGDWGALVLIHYLGVPPLGVRQHCQTLSPPVERPWGASRASETPGSTLLHPFPTPGFPGAFLSLAAHQGARERGESASHL